MAVDEWDSWLKWDGTIEVLPSFESRRQSTANSSYGSEPSGPNTIGNPEPIIYSEDDALFELDEPTILLPFLSQSFTENDDTKPDLNSIGQTVENPGRPLHAYSTLSAMEERRLRDIAMPDDTTARIINIEEQDSSVAIAVKVRGRPRGVKRKCSTSKEDQIDLCQYQKQSHNTIEKRYRINLNDKLDKLRQRIPKFHDTPSKMTEGDEEETSHEAGSPSSYKFGKAAVLTGAVEYISQLENSTQRLGMETAALKARLAAFEKLAMAESIFSGGEMYPDTPILECLEGNRADPLAFLSEYES